MIYYGIKCIGTNLTAKDHSSVWELTERGYECWCGSMAFTDLNAVYRSGTLINSWPTFRHTVEEMPEEVALKFGIFG